MLQQHDGANRDLAKHANDGQRGVDFCDSQPPITPCLTPSAYHCQDCSHAAIEENHANGQRDRRDHQHAVRRACCKYTPPIICDSG
jgi:hypothetical protein